MKNDTPRLILIDGFSLLNRAFYALPPLTNDDGVPTGAVFGFATMLAKIITEYKPDYLVVAIDMPGPTFRHKMYDGYKATRRKTPEELVVQVPILKDMLQVMNIAMVGVQGYEADDVIGTLTKRYPVMSYVVTGDKDSLQLIDDNTTILLTKKGISEIALMDRESLYAAMSLNPSQIIDYKALAGDSSDNIPGIAGVGDKTAIGLLTKYGTLDGVFAHQDEITGAIGGKVRAGKDNAYLSYDLAAIDCKVPLDTKLGDLRFGFPFGSEVKEFFAKHRFGSLIKRGSLFGEIGDSDDIKDDILISTNKAVAQSSVAAKYAPKTKKTKATINYIQTKDELAGLSANLSDFSLHLGQDLHIAVDTNTEYIVKISNDLLGEGLGYDEAIGILKAKLECNHTTKVLLDAKSAMHKLSVYNICLRAYQDVGIMQYLVDMSVEHSDIIGLFGFYAVSPAEPASGLMYVASELGYLIDTMGMTSLYRDIELPLVKVLYNMEKHGFCVDTAMLNSLRQQYNLRLQELAADIHSLAGEDFNINSPKQLGGILFDKLAIPYPKKKAASYSTAADILDELKSDYPIVAKVLEYRGLTKLVSTYVLGLLDAAGVGGTVHTTFKQTLTTTGRLSTVAPNLQNIPVREGEGKALRRCFVPSKENILVAADYSQIELRLLAHYSGDPRLVEAFRQGADIHTRTAAEVFGVDEDNVTSSMRRSAKAVNFGIIYGISDFGLSGQLGVPLATAKEYISKYLNRFGEVAKFQSRMITECRQTGSAKTVFGRVRNIPQINAGNYNLRSFGERAAINMPLQGTAADIIKIAMVRIDDALSGMKSRLILQVHDELIIDAHPSELKDVVLLVRSIMESACTLSVPLVVDITTGSNWLEQNDY